MSEAFIKRNVKLLSEFDGYMTTHPELLDAIPNNAYVIVTLNDDQNFNRQSFLLVRNPRRKTIVEAHKSGEVWSIRPLQSTALSISS